MVGIYIHIPYCRQKCGYCSFYSVTDALSAADYLSALEREIKARTAGQKKKIDTVYIGGGTPSVLPRGSIARILDTVRARFTVVTDSEITVEANPESCSAGFAAECVTAGVNRFSLGLQSHDDAILHKIGRLHSYGDFLRAIGFLERAGVGNVGVDLMTGLPGQSRASLLQSLQAATAASKAVKHISLYALTVEEGTPLYAQGCEPDEDFQAELYGAAVDFLEGAGFRRYEVSNFAVGGFESRHNRKYWTGEEYYGFGAAAHSFFQSPVAVRIENHAELGEYLKGNFEKGREEITAAERTKEIIMLMLRTREGLDLSALKKETGCDLLNEKAESIARLTKLGLLEKKPGKLLVSNAGFYVLNSILLKLL